MILQEYLEKCPDNLIIRIGVKEAYIFIGSVREYKIVKDMIDETELSKWRKKIAAKRIEYENLLANGAPPNKKIEKVKNTLEKYEDRLNNYVPLLKRKIKQVYPSIDRPNCISIILEGDERGNFWLLEEMR